ncbi:MAG: hypothetical protein WBN68_10805 [Sedimenticolaceae bacterium]
MTGLVELLLIVGLLVWFGVSQLRSLRKDDRRTPEDADDKVSAPRD